MSSLSMPTCMTIPDDFAGFDKDLFLLPAKYRESVSHVLIPHGMVQDRVEKLASDIFADHVRLSPGQPLIMLCVLKGGFQFFSDLQAKLKTLITKSHDSFQVFSEFIRCKSYVNDASTNEVVITGMNNLDRLNGSNVLIVEDIIDTGKTMQKLLSTLTMYSPRRLSVACLLRKRTPLSSGYIPDYLGFEVPNHFVVGHGFDYNDNFRDMLHVCVINKHGINKFRQPKEGEGDDDAEGSSGAGSGSGGD